jgi:hypothetical protein
LILLSTLTKNEQQHFTSYPNHKFVFSYHHPEDHGTSRVQFTKDIPNERLLFTSDSEGKLIFEKQQKNGGAAAVTVSSRRGKHQQQSYGVRTRSEVAKDQPKKISLMVRYCHVHSSPHHL